MSLLHLHNSLLQTVTRFWLAQRPMLIFPPGLQLSHSACHSHTDQKGFCKLLSLMPTLYVSVRQMLQLRDAHLKDIITTKPKGPEAWGALLSNVSERESWPPCHQQYFLQHLVFLLEVIQPNSNLMQPCITHEPTR